jgi:hypothetical protein
MVVILLLTVFFYSGQPPQVGAMIAADPDQCAAIGTKAKTEFEKNTAVQSVSWACFAVKAGDKT